MCKQINYPMGRILSVKINDLGEVTGAEVFKGNTREVVKRHSSVLIPLLTKDTNFPLSREDADAESQVVRSPRPRKPKRASAVECTNRIREILSQESSTP